MPRPRSLYPYPGPDISILPNHRTFLICLDRGTVYRTGWAVIWRPESSPRRGSSAQSERPRGVRRFRWRLQQLSHFFGVDVTNAQQLSITTLSRCGSVAPPRPSVAGRLWLDSNAANVVQHHFNTSASPFSLREKAGMRGIESNAFFDDFDPLTPTLSRREREKDSPCSGGTGTLDRCPYIAEHCPFRGEFWRRHPVPGRERACAGRRGGDRQEEGGGAYPLTR